MEFRLRPWVSWSFLQNNHQAVKKMNNSSILDIGHSPYYIALGSTHTHKVIK